MSEPSAIIYLGDFALGATGIVTELTADKVVRRLCVEMGSIPDREVTALRSAPLNDSVECSMLDSLVTLRRRDVRHGWSR